MTQALWQAKGLKRALLWVASLAFTWHMAAITLPQVPRNSAFGSMFYDFFGPYIRRSGTWGAWEMFTTIPYYHKLTVVLRVRDSQGETTMGSMLPNFDPMDQHIRVMLYFLRLVWPDGLTESYRTGYIEKACAAYGKKFGRPAFSITLIAQSEKLRKLSDAALDGVMGDPQNYEKGPFPCPASPPSPN